MVTVSLLDFLSDKAGRLFSGLIEKTEINFGDYLDFFNNTTRQRRMEDAQEHFNLPALAGIVVELEKTFPYLVETPRKETERYRQAAGVIVRMIMEELGWHKTTRQGSFQKLSKVFSGATIYVR